MLDLESVNFLFFDVLKDKSKTKEKTYYFNWLDYSSDFKFLNSSIRTGMIS